MSERKMPSIDDYPSNAIGEDKDDVRPALRGKVKRKKSVWRSVGDRFISEDADHVGSSLLNDIFFPTLIEMLAEMLHGAIDMTINSDGGGYYRGSSRRRRRGGSFISYDRYYDDRDRRCRRRRDDDYDDDDDDDYIISRRGIDFSEFRFEFREDADDIFELLCDRLERYHQVTLAWYLDKIGKTVPGNWTTEDWGWTNFSGVRVRGNSRHGWYIDLPRPKEL